MEEGVIEKMNTTEYKTYHESLMQNNHGSSALHVFFCILFTVQCTIFSAVRIKSIPYQEFLEYTTIVIPMIAVHTILSDYFWFLNVIIFVIILNEVKTHLFLKYRKKMRREKSYHHRRIQTISVLRGLTYLITVFCILAVDFRSFPRELAKTERYGYSLMDTGVGLFILMSGLVHKDLRRNHWTTALLGNLKFVVLLAALGMARYASVKQLDYQEHVSEYGVHWNFFFTLAVCKFFSTFLLYFSSESYLPFCYILPLLQSFLLLGIHELVLYCGVQDWVFGDTPRNSLLSANREGLSSCLGYVAMYLFAAQIKDELTNKHQAGNRYYKGFRIDMTFVKFVVGSMFLWILTYLTNYLRPASRTLANASYCIFIETVFITIVSIFYYFEKYFFNDQGNLEAPKIIDNVNSNGLLYFLAANLITGTMNLSMRTLLVSNDVSFLLLNVYMIATLALLKYVKKVDGILFH